ELKEKIEKANKEAEAAYDNALNQINQTKMWEEMTTVWSSATSRVVELYSKFPFDTDEATGLTAQYLGNHPKGTEIVTEVQKNIAKRVSQRTRSELDTSVQSIKTTPNPSPSDRVAPASAEPVL
ncbi:MAG TPA: hypothetical protein VK968_04705, partial [Roseimicrobium sp.]|nr:hypothetical protein [Roseimicrobium sp.]